MAATAYVTLPLPVPLAFDVAVTQLGKALMLHGQLEPAPTLIVPLVALDVKLKLAGDMVGAVGQVGEAACVTVAVLLPNMNDAVRAAPVALAAAVKLTGIVPAGAICNGALLLGVNHAGRSVASNRQPGAAVTFQLTRPPSPETVWLAAGKAIFWVAQAWSHTQA